MRVESPPPAPTHPREAPTGLLPEGERTAVFAAHDAFQKPLRNSGELLGFAALADPPNSATARRREETAAAMTPSVAPAADDMEPATDDTLTLLLLCCHPALSPPSHAA